MENPNSRSKSRQTSNRKRMRLTGVEREQAIPNRAPEHVIRFNSTL